ncbi:MULTISPECIES: sensor histidine kinase [Oceanobacillus]|uniref:histidine kinase n=1 Tax=Oceanobacillus kimchii TaxID=746691 RepID=A0ABQ5TQT4_9BACI|nr:MULTISPECIES: sensor histidine kinase [Oceanobacillus]MBT2600490.1 sensor histidine kinase [Oceanobacillus sp. ISL-74]MBT2650648.1 sensor histidine kinase [Oceanobacillus sp. ISL-73]GLO67540.1 sensor histidine kinase DesK [Oceanobacillus kimchii]
MQHWYHLFPKNTGLSLFAWIAFCLLPFYFVLRSSSPIEIAVGVIMIVLFFATYRLAFIKKGWTVYVSVGIEIFISVGVTLYFGYVYFSLFLAFFIGNIQNKAGFISLYVIHLVTTLAAVSIGFFIQEAMFYTQWPFIIICVIGVILLPFTMYNRNKREKLENQLENANQKIAQLIVLEERERIARDLHDTLGQKLSLMGLKSELAGKLVDANPESAKNELVDIHQTARTALKEVRELVSGMKGTRLKDELIRVRQLLEVAQITFEVEDNLKRWDAPLLIENVLSMCLKEAVTNVVKHSEATECKIVMKQTPDKWTIRIIDNGIGIQDKVHTFKGNGILGMKERLGFVNGSLSFDATNKSKTILTIQVPRVIQQTEQEESN